MQLRDIMTKNPQTITPNATLCDAAAVMNRLNCGVIPVVENGKVVGIFTDRDLTIRAVAQRKNPEREQVRSFMTPNPQCCFEDRDVKEAVQFMEQKQIRRLPIMNRSNQLVGIVSLGDLATHIHNQQLSGEVIEKVSETRQAAAAPAA